MKKTIAFMLFAVFCMIGTSITLKAQTTSIDQLVERLDQIGDYHGSINDFFTQEEQLQLKAHFSKKNNSLSENTTNRASGVPAYCAMNSTNEFGRFDAGNGSTVTTIGSSPIGEDDDSFEGAGAIQPGSNTAYVIAEDNNIYTVDTQTGNYTLVEEDFSFFIGDWIAAEFDPTTGSFYAIDSVGQLMRMEVPSLNKFALGSTGFSEVGATALAIDGDGNAYVYTFGDDSLYSLNLETAEPTLIGSIGFDANFGGGMFWDPSTDQIYMTAFNNDVFDSELRLVDTSTGATSLINRMEIGVPTQYGWASPLVVDSPPPPTCTVFENFEAGLPAGWSTVVNTGDCDWANQTETPTIFFDFPTLAMVFDDDACGDGAPASNVSLLSDVYDTTNAESILIGYDAAFQEFGDQDETLIVEVWDGSSWQEIAFYDESFEQIFQNESNIDVTAFANANFQVRWTYDDAGAWGWFAGVDNFCMNIVSSPLANVQIIHNSPDPSLEIVDLYLNNQLIGDDVPFRTASSFFETPSGVPTSFDFADASSGVEGDILNPDDSLFNFTTTFEEDENYILIANGVLDPDAFETDNAFEITAYAGARIDADDPELVDILVHHGSPDAPTIDINEPDEGGLVSNIAYPEFQGYLSLPDADYVLEVALAGSPDALLAYELPLLNANGFAVTIIASGFFGEDAGDNGFGLWLAAAVGGPLFELPVIVDPSTCTVFEDFEGGIPEGWSTEVNSGDCDWEFTSVTPTGDDFPTQAIVYDDDACGDGAPASNVSLLSDVYNTSGSSSVLIGYDVYFQEIGDQEFVVEVWDGVEWQQIAIYDETLDPDIQTETAIDATAFANADFQVRWTYSDIDGSWGWGAGIDNFCLNSETLGTTDNEIVGFDYYPNPATNEINLSAQSTINNVVLYNILGQKVLDQNVGNLSTRLDVSRLSAGTYIMRVSVDGQVASYKIVKR